MIPPQYNPGRLSDQEITALFIARRPLFERIMADLAAETPQSRAQHHLIIGQRGMGKTTLLTRIRAELNTNPDLKPRFIPLVFAEEQYTLDRLSKFWLNCLDSLADALDQVPGQQSQVAAIDNQVKQINARLGSHAKNDAPLAEESLAAFLNAVQATGRRPVLLVDNLQLVFERLNTDAQHALRELLMRPGCPLLIGTSPSPLPEGQDYGAAFYDYFKVHFLRPLELDEMENIILQLAEQQKRDNVRRSIQEHPERLAVLRHLTGGNPRTVVIIYSLYAENFSNSVYQDLEDLLDRVTPVYKARFEELSAQQQIVAAAVANHWDPVTGRQLTELTGLAANQISPQLDRLEKIGFIEKTELSGESSTGYLIAERFFNIWFLMRNASRRQRREVKFLARFLQSFYDARERCQLAHDFLQEHDLSPDRYTLTLALADSVNTDSPHTAESVRRHAHLDILRQNERQTRAEWTELLNLSDVPPATLDFHQLRKKILKLAPANAGISAEAFADEILGDIGVFRSGIRELLAGQNEPFSPEKYQAMHQRMQNLRAKKIKRYSREAVEWFSQELVSGQIRSFDNVEDWNRIFCMADDHQACALMVDQLQDSDLGAKLNDEAFSKICRLLRPSSEASARSWSEWASRLNLYLQRFDEAEKAYREAIQRDPKDVAPWFYLGNLLQVHLKHFDEAEAAYRKAIQLNPKYAAPWNNLGNLLRTHLKRFDEAEKAYCEAIQRNPKYASPWNGLGNLYTDFLNRPQDADNAFAKCLELEPQNESALENLIFLHRDFLGEGAAAKPRLAALESRSDLKCPDVLHLHRTLFAAYDANWGIVRESLAAALGTLQDGFPPATQEDWLRASAVLVHLNYGSDLLALLKERGDDVKLRPWYEALAALIAGDKSRLQNVAPEIRNIAEILYDNMERRLKKLPLSTNRRPQMAATQSRRPKK
jgi:tetratricopeptide (TPR) repeat protein/DNA-binding MarR family transcriptional regulator